MYPHFTHNRFLASLSPTSSTSAVVGTDARDEDTGSKGLVDTLAKENTGTVALVSDGDGDEKYEDEGGKKTIEVNVCAHE